MSLTEDFREAMSAWATGVSVVATRADELEYGVTVSSFTSLSLEPPLVLVCLQNRSAILPMIEQVRAFSISMLAHGQAAESKLFAGSGREPAPRVDAFVREPASELPIVDGALAWVACSLHARHVQGDHTIVIGRVQQARSEADRRPLLYHRRAYHALP
jgi:flavin reductase (NADH)